jgi:hypothetical protein
VRRVALIGGVVGLVIGVIGGLIAGSLFAASQATNDVYRATITGAVVGGVFALLGGGVGSLLLLFFEGRRAAAKAREDFIGAVLSVKIGLEANYTAIEAAITPPWTGAIIPAGLVSDSRYLAAERLLAARLPAALLSKVGSSYAMVPLAIHMLGTISGGSLPAREQATLKHIADKAREADVALGAYITTELKVEAAGK